MEVKYCMCDKVTSCRPESTVRDCAKLMNEHHVGCIPVCDSNNNIVGLITDRDIVLRTIACDKDTNHTKVSDIMTCGVHCCSPQTEVKEAENLMKENQIRRIPVVENNKVVGILTLGDLVNSKQVNNQGICDTLECICRENGENAE